MSKARHEKFRPHMVGRVFGRLTVLGLAGVVNYKTFYKCQCSCGNITDVIGTSLLNGDTSSCGCYSREMTSLVSTMHGLRSHPLYNILNGMIQRCHNPNNSSYPRWGGLGVRVCDEWRYNVVAFYKWAMDNGYRFGLSIDRFPDKEGNYEPGNCRWATDIQQARNKRNNKLDEEKARLIRADPRTNQEIASDYGVSDTMIGYVKSEKSWKVE